MELINFTDCSSTNSSLYGVIGCVINIIIMSDALFNVSKVISKVFTLLFKGSIFKVASERIPSTPSDPTNNLVKSSPTTPLDVLTPVLWISPVPDMNSNPKILSLGVPYLIALGPAELFAIFPPIVE